MRIRMLVTMLVALASVDGQAQDRPGGWYAGAALGHTRFGDSGDRDDTGVSAHAGFRFSRHAALEVRYADQGGYVAVFDCQSDFCVPTKYPYSNTFDFRAVDLALLWFLPVSERVELYASVGGGRSRGTVLYVPPSNQSHEFVFYSTDPVYGLGVRVRASRAWAVRAQVERRDGLFGGDIDFDTFWLGGEYRFGGG